MTTATKVKIIYAWSFQTLRTEMDEWFAANKNIEIVSMASPTDLTLIIAYRDESLVTINSVDKI